MRLYYNSNIIYKHIDGKENLISHNDRFKLREFDANAMRYFHWLFYLTDVPFAHKQRFKIGTSTFSCNQNL